MTKSLFNEIFGNNDTAPAFFSTALYWFSPITELSYWTGDAPLPLRNRGTVVMTSNPPSRPQRSDQKIWHYPISSSGDFLPTTTIGTSDPYTLVQIFRVDTGSSTNSWRTSGGVSLCSQSSNLISTSPGGGPAINTNISTQQNPVCFVATRSNGGDTLTTYVNSIIPSQTVTDPLYVRTVNVGSLGTSNSSSSFLGDALFFNRVLSINEIAQVMDYAQRVYGVRSILPYSPDGILSGAQLWISPFNQLQGVTDNTAIPELTNYGTGGQTITQATAGSRPRKSTANGVPVVSTTGGLFMTISPMITFSTGDATVMMVSRLGGAGTVRAVALGGSSDNTYWATDYISPTTVRVLFRNTVNVGVTQNANVPSSTANLSCFILVKRSSDCDLYVNSGTILATIPSITGTFNYDSFGRFASLFSDANFGDVAYFNRALSSGEVSSAMTTLKTRYGIA
jgi:hypothetical protein